MVQSACCYHFLLRFESFSKMEGYEGYFTRWIWWSILTFFTIFDISPLWMDQFGQNWWPNRRFFDALNESGKVFDRYGPQIFWKTLEAGAKMEITIAKEKTRQNVFQCFTFIKWEKYSKIHDGLKALQKIFEMGPCWLLYLYSFRNDIRIKSRWSRV